MSSPCEKRPNDGIAGNNTVPRNCDDEDGHESSVLTRKLKGELREWLFAFRKRYYNYWVVLDNNSVYDIVEMLPMSLEELQSVSGLGENKIRNHGDLIIATTWAFLHNHGLLSKMPAMVKGGYLHEPPVDVVDCPSWRNPHSCEAQEIQERLKESDINMKKAAMSNTVSFSEKRVSAEKKYVANIATPESTNLSCSASNESRFLHYEQSPESPSLLAIENRHPSNYGVPVYSVSKDDHDAGKVMGGSSLQNRVAYSAGGSVNYSNYCNKSNA